MAWDRLLQRMSHKNRFEDGALVSIDEDPDKWITELESFRAQIDDNKFSTTITGGDFWVHVLSNLPQEYDTVLDGLQSRLSKSGPEEVIVEDT